MTGVSEPVLAGQNRISRLFDALDDMARLAAACNYRDLGLAKTLEQMWAQIADLLEQHADTEEESRSGRICAAIAEAHRHDPGCPAWWRAVRAARRVSRKHHPR